MKELLRNQLGVIAILLATTAVGLSAEKATTGSPERVRIAMVNTLFRDTPPSVIRVMMQPFAALMESQTGLPGELIPGGDAAQLGQLLSEDKADVGVFHGFEFAWARQRHPDLRPLLVAINQDRLLQALIVTRTDASAGGLAELRSKTLALPRCTREHCYLFLENRCLELGQEPSRFFSTIMTPPTVEDALDDVVDGIVQSAIVDGVSLKCYERRKPGRFAQLQAIQRSELFPAAVVAYRPGTMDESTVQRFRDGLIKANKSALGRQFLTLWKLTAFEPVPADYEQTLADILKAYPHAAAKQEAKAPHPAGHQASE
jgi:ABC-type phosphate/phosphonate transport system substrate-binding protein